MLKDHFQKSINTLNSLRSEHFKVSEYLSKGKYKLKQKFFGKGKKHYDFDINSQQFFHEYVDDIVFEPTEIQEFFYNRLTRAFERQPHFSVSIPREPRQSNMRKNPSEVRAILARHYQNRKEDLSYKKYRTLLRLHNYGEEQNFMVVRSRTNLIDKEIQLCISRNSRLETEDYFEVSYTQGGKPVPINENGQPIYKYLDEEDCWFSNIARDDIIGYSRYNLYRQGILEEAYWPYYYEIKNLVFTHGIEIGDMAESYFSKQLKIGKEKAIKSSKRLISILEKDLQDISPGNLQEKENLINFIYAINGVNDDRPNSIPKYPSIHIQLLEMFDKILQAFFKNLYIGSHKDIVAHIPKFNSFCAIMFKYQNQEILEGEKEIKLGLDDDIDIRKQLITMLEELWVRNFIKIDFTRFDYKMYLKPLDWQLDEYSLQLEKEVRYVNDNGYCNDCSLEEILRLVRMNSYSEFRKIMKKRSEKVVERLPDKYIHMEIVQKYIDKSDEEINLQKLQSFYKMKTSDIEELFESSILKENSSNFLKVIMKNYLITNPVQLEILETLNCIRVRETRTKIMNTLNGLRCYHRNIDIDLRVIEGCEFKFELDDNMLINSNKQLIEKFEKTMKDNETTYSKPPDSLPTIDSEDFMLHNTLQKSMMYKKDRVEKKNYGEEIPHILVADGSKLKNNILYDIVLEDLKLVESRILEVGTHFINRYERMIKMKNLPQLADRMSIISELFQLELHFLFAKFNLVQHYYYIYENTTEPLHAHKISNIIIELIYAKPEIDYSSDNFSQSYMLSISQLKEESKVIEVFTGIMEKKEKEANKNFHKKFAEMHNIPLTLWAYIYGDIEGKGKTATKLQRMNSVTSKLSRNSKESKEKVLMDIRKEIREQFGEGESDDDEFNIEEYDEYMLKRNMDDIFEDIVENKQGEKEKDSGIGVSALGMENVTINPRFEGGPHPELNYLPEVQISTERKQKLVNFSESLCWVGNVREMLKDLRNEHKEKYGFCSQQYHTCILAEICRKIHSVLLNPPKEFDKMYNFATEDPYFQLVTKAEKNFEEVMAPILDLPSPLQLQLPSTHERHQMLLPNFQVLQNFDINLIKNLVKLEKPVNTACYRELNLGINFIEFLKLREQIWHIQLEREQILNAYIVLGKNTETLIQKYSHCYSRSGQSQIFISASQLKIFSPSFLKNSVFNDSVEELRTLCNLERADINLFRQIVCEFKYEAEAYVRAMRDIENENRNKIFDRNSILLSQDKKNIKMVKNRVIGYLSSLGSDSLKGKSYAKFKLKMKTLFEEKCRALKEKDLDELIVKNYLDGNAKKFNQYCVNLLDEKVKKLLTLDLIQKYTADLCENHANVEIIVQTHQTIRRLRNYIDSLPYLSKLFTMPSEHQHFIKKIFYDQKKLKVIEQSRDNSSHPTYIYSHEQLTEDWLDVSLNQRINNLTQQLQFEEYLRGLLPPESKEQLFKWMFRIPSNSLQENGKEAMRHFLKIGSSYTGKTSHSEYRCGDPISPTRNKFLELHEKYTILLQYIESNIALISLQVDDDIFDSLHSLIDTHCIFEDRYYLADETVIYEDNTANGKILAPCFVYDSKKEEIEKRLKMKINSRGYMEKKMHWAVVDEILDFIISKVQGYGAIRHSMLELKDEIEFLQQQKPETVLKFLKQKTENVYKILWLSLWDTYLSQNNEEFNSRIKQISGALSVSHCTSNLKSPLSSNQRVDINPQISTNFEVIEQEKLKFSSGIHNSENAFLVTQLKPIFSSLPFHMNSFIEDEIYSAQNGENLMVERGWQHNWAGRDQFRKLFKTLGKESRFQYFSHCRSIYEDVKSYVETKIQPNSTALKMIESEEIKSSYLSYLIESKVQMIGLTELKLCNMKEERSWEKFSSIWKQNREIIEYNTFSVYDQLENYKESGKIQFSKTEQLLASSSRSEGADQINKVIRQIIFAKLAREELKSEVLNIAIKMLKSEKIPQVETKKIINTSLIPRVHLIAGYSSPLVLERKTYVSQQYKLAFVQAFINRFRNKVSRVDLLSSGYGFVITVPDLEDCVNFMNKLLFTFTEKQFNHRLDTFSQYYEILIEAVRSRNKTIAKQSAIIKMLQDKVKNVLEAEYLAKVSKLLQEKILVEQKLKIAETATNGMELRVRKAVQYEYERKMAAIESENRQLKAKFNEFKDILVKLTKDTTKNNFLDIVNIFRNQVSQTLNKKIDLQDSFNESSSNSKKTRELQKVTEEFHPDRDESERSREKEEKEESKQKYRQEDIQKCKIGEDIIHDPYYTTKLINKMRVFNLFKMGCRRIKFEEKEGRKNEEMSELHQIQDRVVAQTQREQVLRSELIRAQEELSKKSLELQKMKQGNQSLENEKAKLKILINTKERKIEQKEREIDELKKKPEEKEEESKIENKTIHDLANEKSQDDLPKLSGVRQHKKSSNKKIARSFITGIDYERQGTLSLYEKFELSNKDSTWREKCEQLYIENKRLLAELDKFKSRGANTPMREGNSLNLRNKKTSDQSERETHRSEKPKFPNLSFKYSVMKQ